MIHNIRTIIAQDLGVAESEISDEFINGFISARKAENNGILGVLS